MKILDEGGLMSREGESNDKGHIRFPFSQYNKTSGTYKHSMYMLKSFVLQKRNIN